MYILISIIGPPVYQCGEHWSGGPSSLVRGAKEKLSIPPIGCPQNLCAKSVRKILCAKSCAQSRRPPEKHTYTSEIDRVNLRNLEESRKPRFF